MNTKIIVTGLVLLAAAIAAIFWIMVPTAEEDVQDTTNPPIVLPSGDPVPTGSGDPTTPEPDALTVTAQNNVQIMTNDFLANGVTIPDTSNPGRFLLAGDLGYCVKEPQKCQAGTDMSYQIYYSTSTSMFSIALAEEPLGAVRSRAEQFLLTELGITESEMCQLKYYLGTSAYINPQFAGKNLGFSFCPGATALPN